MASKTVCERHDWAHEVGTACKWCEPDKGAPRVVTPESMARAIMDAVDRAMVTTIGRTYGAGSSCACQTCALAWAGLDDDE